MIADPRLFAVAFMRTGRTLLGEAEDRAKLRLFFAEIAEEFGVELAYLFGSRAQIEGRAGPLSDYDFALLLREELAFPRRYELAYRLARCLGVPFDRIDLVVLNAAPIELRYGVVATGILLYEVHRAVRVEFEARTLGRYFDYLPVLRRQRADLLRSPRYGLTRKGKSEGRDVGEDEGKGKGKGKGKGERDFADAARIQRYRAALREAERVLAKARAA